MNKNTEKKEYIELIRKAAEIFDITESQLLKRRGVDPIVKARHAVWFYMNKSLGWGEKQIAAVAERDKDTVKHALESYQNRIDVGSAVDPAILFERERAPVWETEVVQ